jgi:AraC-like DNA-binding protein
MRTTRYLAAGLGAALAFGVGGAAFAASTPTAPSSPPGLTWFLDQVAQNLGVSPAALKSAVEKAEISAVQRLESEGRISASRAQTLETKIESGHLVPFAFHRPFAGHGLLGMRGRLLTATADFLGVSPATLQGELRQGKSLAAIAEADGKTLQQLEAAVATALQADLQKAVTAGRITQAEADAMLSRLEKVLPTLLQKTWPAHPASPSPSGGQG